MGYDASMTICVGTCVTVRDVTKFPDKARLFITDLLYFNFVSSEYQFNHCDESIKDIWKVLCDEGIEICVRKTNFTHYEDDAEDIETTIETAFEDSNYSDDDNSKEGEDTEDALSICDDILSTLSEYQIGFRTSRTQNSLTTFYQYTCFPLKDSIAMFKEQRKILRPLFDHLSRKLGLEEEVLTPELLVELDAGPS